MSTIPRDTKIYPLRTVYCECAHYLLHMVPGNSNQSNQSVMATMRPFLIGNRNAKCIVTYALQGLQFCAFSR